MSPETMDFKKNFDSIRGSRAFIICTVALAVFVDLFLYGLIIPILPTLLTNRAHVTSSKLQVTLAGLLAAYNAAVVVCAPITGYLADRWSNRKIPLLGGLFALAGSTVLFMLSKNLGLLYLARVLQGASASIVWSVGLALLVDAVGPENIGSAMGWVTLGLSLGNTCGPLIGGIVYQRAGHYATFSLGIGVIAVDILLRFLLLEPRSQLQVVEGPQIPQDLKDSNTSGGKSGGAVEVTPQQESDLERQQENQSPPGAFLYFKLLTYSDLLCSLWAVFLITFVLTGLEAVIPLHVEKTFRWSSQGAGLIFLSLVLPIFLSPFIGKASDRFGSRPLSTAGLLLATIFGPLLALIRYFSIGRVVFLVILLFMIGIGVSLVMTPEMAAISAFAPKDDPDAFGTAGAAAQCSALMTIATALAGVIGPVTTGGIQASSGWIATSVSVGAFAALGLLSLLLKTGYDRIFERRKRAGTQPGASQEEGTEMVDVEVFSSQL